jgi:hypothetical protein
MFGFACRACRFSQLGQSRSAPEGHSSRPAPDRHHLARVRTASEKHEIGVPAQPGPGAFSMSASAARLAGRRLTVRLDHGLLQLVQDGMLLRSLPNPPTPSELARIRDADPPDHHPNQQPNPSKSNVGSAAAAP